MRNLVGKTDGSSGWSSFDLTGTIAVPLDPLLQPLQDNGGPTPTMALHPNSAAVDRADERGMLEFNTDQRGLPRLSGPEMDIGAFEFQQCEGFVLSVPADGPGNVARNPIQDCYVAGSPVTLTATADPGSVFVGWASGASGTANPLLVTLNSNKTIRALFYRLPLLVTTTSDSGGGSLRHAISNAISADRITFAPVVQGEIRLISGELLINKALRIEGPGGAKLRLSGNTNSRLFPHRAAGRRGHLRPDHHRGACRGDQWNGWELGQRAARHAAHGGWTGLRGWGVERRRLSWLTA